MNLRLIGIDESVCTWDENENPLGVRYALPDGWRYVVEVNRLLDVISPEKGSALHRLRAEDLSAADDAGQRVMDRRTLRALLDLLEGVEHEAERGFTDNHWHVRPEKLAWLRERIPDLLEDTFDPDGKPVQSLSGVIAGAIIARNFLENAWRLGCEVAVD